MVRATGAVLVGLLILAGGLLLRRSPEAAIQTVGEVLAAGGAVVAAIGTWQLVVRFLHSREE